MDSPIFNYGKPMLQRDSYQRSSTQSSLSPRNSARGAEARGSNMSANFIPGGALNLPQNIKAREYQVSDRHSSTTTGRGHMPHPDDELSPEELKETMNYVHEKLKEQVQIEERYLKEMQVVKTNN